MSVFRWVAVAGTCCWADARSVGDGGCVEAVAERDHGCATTFTLS